MKLLTLTLVLFTGACAYHPTMEGDRYLIILEFYTKTEAARICIEEYNAAIGTEGCTICTGTFRRIIINRRKSCLDHEIDHVLYADWHGARKAECSERANWRQ